MSVPTIDPELKRDPVPPVFLSEVEAARACGVSRPVFRKWVAAGLILPVPLPEGTRRNLYLHSALEDFAARLAVGAR